MTIPHSNAHALFSPNGAKYRSPGQRPGTPIPENHQALKGRHKNSDHAPVLSTTNLKLCRSFYLTYREIGQTLPDRSSEAIGNISPAVSSSSSSSHSLLEKMGQILSAESFQSLAPSLIHASEYKLYLPSKQELKAQIEQVNIINENQKKKGEVQ